MSLFAQKMSKIIKNKAKEEQNSSTRSMCSIGKISWHNNKLSSNKSYCGSKLFISPINKAYSKEKDNHHTEEDNSLIASLITYYNNRILQLVSQNKSTPKAKVKDILIEQERLISSLYEEIAKIRSSEEMKRNEIIRLNRVISAMKSNMENLQCHNSCLSKENASISFDYKSNMNSMLQQQKEAYNAIEENNSYYHKKYDELKKIIEIERLTYREQLSDLVKSRGKLLEENCHQNHQFKKEKEQMKNALKNVLSNTTNLKLNCDKMKQECKELIKFNTETIKAIIHKLSSCSLKTTTNISSQRNFDNVAISPTINEDKEIQKIKQCALINKQIQKENAVLIEKKGQLSKEVEKLMNRIIVLENENEALIYEKQLFISKNEQLENQITKLREYYEHILEEKNIKINEVHSAINNSIFSLSNGMTNITKANMLDKEVKEIMKQITPDFSFSQSIQPNDNDE